MKIKAAIARAEPRELAIETVDLAPPRADEILVRLVASGVCHTDIKARDIGSPTPIVLGHEGAGIVEATGAAIVKVKAGDPVVMTYNSCGTCPSCLAHAPTYCYELRARNFGGLRADGTSPISRQGERIHANFFGQSSFASHALCTERNVVKVAGDAPLELLGPLGCGIQTGAGAVINAFGLRPGRSIAVFGAGAVGISAMMAARLSGAAQIIAVDVIGHRLKTALDLAATHAVNSREEDALAAIKRITGHGVDFALDTSGVVAVMQQAFESLGARGTCGIIASGAVNELTISIRHLMGGGRRLVGIIEGESNPDLFIPMLIELYRQGRFPFDKLVKFYPFERINEAIHDSETGATIKPVLRFPQ
ncbi:MAG TPA: NAD(P)-dependent alcohol dehydrogenase [Stellaceae bacterium]|nr:NAD(P)-dependent alcohol dehydrogenase [Stellaceae bacterium]